MVQLAHRRTLSAQLSGARSSVWRLRALAVEPQILLLNRLARPWMRVRKELRRWPASTARRTGIHQRVRDPTRKGDRVADRVVVMEQ